MKTLRIGSRGSALALAQARTVADLLGARGVVDTTLVTIRTSGDQVLDRSVSMVGGKGLFTKELEDALLEGAIDAAVHSSKDMPAAIPSGLSLAAALPREDPADALVLPHGRTPTSFEAVVRSLGAAPRLGTGSARRIAQLSAVMPSARFQSIRGNVDTRLRKLDEGEVDALVLAVAGLRRLGLHERITSTIPFDVCLPSPGQGTIVVQTRTDDPAIANIWGGIGDIDAMTCLRAERAVVSRLGGACDMPIGATASIDGGMMTVECVIAAPDGSRMARSRTQGPAQHAEEMGIEVAERALKAGGDEILRGLSRRREEERHRPS